MKVWTQTINFVLGVPLPFHKPAIQQAGQIMRNAALLNPKFLGHFIHIMWLVPEQLHDREAGLVRKSAKELAIKVEFQANLLDI